MPAFSQGLERALHQALTYANERHHEYATLEHLLLALIDDADAYQQEGQMTTFFANGAGRQVVDCWSTRVASFRTADIVIIRRVQRESVSARD